MELGVSTSFNAVYAANICVISGSHLSIHGIDRDTYMEEYRLSPDKLCAKEFRRLHSLRRDYYPYGKRDWMAAIRKLYKRGTGPGTSYNFPVKS